MAFWSVAGPEPKRNYRWYIKFGGTVPELSNLRYALKTVTKPKATIKEAFHASLNHKYYYPGRLEWETIEMKIASSSGPNVVNLLDAITTFSGYGVPDGMETPKQRSTLGKNKFGAALGSTIEIIQVDANGQDIENWKLYNPFFTNITYGSLDYGSEDIVEIGTTVRYDWAQLMMDTNVPSDGQGNAAAESPGFPGE